MTLADDDEMLGLSAEEQEERPVSRQSSVHGPTSPESDGEPAVEGKRQASVLYLLGMGTFHL